MKQIFFSVSYVIPVSSGTNSAEKIDWHTIDTMSASSYSLFPGDSFP